MEWKDVVGFEGIYEVSDTGLIRTHINKTTHSVKHGIKKWKQRTLKQKISKDSTCRIILYKDKKPYTKLVHRIVAESFIEKSEGKDYINHIDGNRLNNHVYNLEWCNHKENNNHAFDTGLIKTCSKIKLINKKTGEEFTFRSMTKASHFLNKAHSFIHNRIKSGKLEIGDYIIEKVNET